MAGKPVPIGPFTGGLNKLEDPRLIGNDQLSICQNLDIGRSGELTLRPGLKLIRTGVGGLTNNLVVIGVGINTTGVNFVFVKDVVTNTLWYTSGGITGGVTGAATAWSQVSASPYTGNKMVQYGSICYFINKSGSSTGISVQLTSSVIIGVVVSNIALPQGNSGFIYKDRLFIYGTTDNSTPSNRVYYSGTTTPNVFPGANFFDINPGDGEGISAAVVLQDSLVFFKNRSTYVLFYDADPGLGTLRKISSSIGTASTQAVVQYENVAYIITNATVYRVQNLLFLDIGRNLNLSKTRLTLPVSTDSTKQDFVFVYATRIICAVYNGSSFIYYVYNVEVDAWVEYTFAEKPDRFFSFNDSATGNLIQQFIASKQGSANLYVYSPNATSPVDYGDYPSNTTLAVMRTKKFSFTDSSHYKRLFWWGMDIMTNGAVSLAAYADSVSSPVATLVGNGSVKYFRAFLSNRGRYIEFGLTASATNQQIAMYPGIAYIGEKTNVNDAVTI